MIAFRFKAMLHGEAGQPTQFGPCPHCGTFTPETFRDNVGRNDKVAHLSNSSLDTYFVL